MRLFQNSELHTGYRRHFEAVAAGASTFSARLTAFIEDRFGACHILQPVLQGSGEAFFTNGNDATLQSAWARENGLSADAAPRDILLAQIEAHRAEVFYNLDPMPYGADFPRRLPGCVKKSVAWRAAPSPGADFSNYDAVVCNFPSILSSYRANGWNAVYFAPAHDPRMDSFAENRERPIDVLFVGGYSRHHMRRAALVEALAGMKSEFDIQLHLEVSKATVLSESWMGRLLPLRHLRRPAMVRAISGPGVYGLEFYRRVSQAKIVLNGAIDMAGTDRGNMRCFETLSCGAALLSDAGVYPEGMVPGSTIATYGSTSEAVESIRQLCLDPGATDRLGLAGYEMIRARYSKEQQLQDFKNIVGNL